MSTLKVTIDPDRCVGYGRCAAIGAGVFMIDEDTGKAVADEADIANAEPRTVFAAARSCPTQAIVIEQFGRRLYPQIIPPMPADIARQLRDLERESSEE